MCSESSPEPEENLSTLLPYLMTFLVIALFIFPLSYPAFADYTPKIVSKLVADVDYRNPTSTGRIPLILIHCVHGTEDDDFGSINGSTIKEKEYFLNLINYFYASDLKYKYKLYRFHYLSDELSVKDIGQGLQEWLDSYIQEGSINDVPLVILAHSMGGLVARSYMQEHKHTVGAYNNQFGGERVIKLITLATPHHGSPGASRDALMLDAFLWESLVWSAIFYYNFTHSPATALSDEQVNRADLRTDDFAFDSGTLIMNDNPWLTALNTNTVYDNKLIAYYSYIDLSAPNRIALYDKVLDFGPNYLALYAPGKDNHAKLLVANIIMNEGLSSHFVFNDGMVPKESGQFEGHTLYKTAKLDNYDHEHMKDGKIIDGQLSTELFENIKADLSDIYLNSDSGKIATAEYFIDTDPGEGNGLPLAAKDGAFDYPSEDIEFSLDTSNLTLGAHTLYIRMKNKEGAWGTPRKILFDVSGEKHISAAEYFIDVDPGQGNGTPIVALD